MIFFILENIIDVFIPAATTLSPSFHRGDTILEYDPESGVTPMVDPFGLQPIPSHPTLLGRYFSQYPTVNNSSTSNGGCDDVRDKARHEIWLIPY